MDGWVQCEFLFGDCQEWIARMMEWRLRSVDGRRGDLVDPWDLG